MYLDKHMRFHLGAGFDQDDIVNSTIYLRRASAALLSVALAACGGGGGGGGSSPPVNPVPPPPAPTPPGCTIKITADTTVRTVQTAGATVEACGSATLASVTWSATGPAPIDLIATRSPTISFQSPTAGVVKLKVDATLADGTAASAMADVTVEQYVSGPSITLRNDHSVRPGAGTSVRAWTQGLGADTVASITWQQISGTPVTMDTSDSRVLMFQAPTAPAGGVLKFRATLATSSGATSSDEVIIGIDPEPAAPNDYLFDSAQRVYPYRTGTVYAGVLKKCTYDNNLYYTDATRNNLCNAGTLPLLQADVAPGAVPTVAQVMARVLVSHDFLGRNFEAFLTNNDPHGDFRRLLSSVTTIVIGSHVRPSFYMAATGAIYLDANNLWMLPEERDVVTEVPDYRSAFDDALNYTALGRLVKSNDYARISYPTTERNARGSETLITDLGRLLYHELAHAGDYFTPADRALNPSLSIWGNVTGRVSASTLPSDALAQQYGLTSAEMKALGQVLYRGATPTAEQKAYTAADVGRFFASDRANDDYAYSISGNSNSREDLAMLFEEFMMSYRHGIQYDTAYSNLYQPGMTADQLLVAWGERGRIAEPAIKPRIKLVLQRVAPWIDPAMVDTLPAPIMMRAGASWEANLNLTSPTSLSSMWKQSAKRTLGGGARDDIKKRPHSAPAWGVQPRN
jgi:hypothetical protein